MSVSSALMMAIAHIFFCCYILFSSFQASNHPFVNGARVPVVVEESNSNAPPSTCSSGIASRGLKVVHRYGPCSPISSEKKSWSTTWNQMYLQDRRRVQAINSMMRSSDKSSGKKASASSHDKHKVDLGQLVAGGMYTTTLSLGTPETEFDFILDTGSYITWVSCNPNGQQPNKYYLPSSSSTWSNASCGGPCDYTQSYFDKSYVSGSFVNDTITIDKSSQLIIPHFVFLCANVTSGDFGKAAGLLGLGPPDSTDKFGQFSLMSQSKTMFNQVFCHCLPTIDESSQGYVYFGEEAIEKCHNFGAYTPLLPNPSDPSYYRVNLIAITIGNKRLNISSATSSPGTIIDSGTAVSRLPWSVYSLLSSEFKKLMRKYPIAPDDSVEKLDTCYNLQQWKGQVSLPNMVLHFTNLDVKLDQRAVLWKVKGPQVICLAFAKKDYETDVTIIGSHQLQKRNVIYDLIGGKVGISPGPGDC